MVFIELSAVFHLYKHRCEHKQSLEWQLFVFPEDSATIWTTKSHSPSPLQQTTSAHHFHVTGGHQKVHLISLFIPNPNVHFNFFKKNICLHDHPCNVHEKNGNLKRIPDWSLNACLLPLTHEETLSVKKKQTRVLKKTNQKLQELSRSNLCYL